MASRLYKSLVGATCVGAAMALTACNGGTPTITCDAGFAAVVVNNNFNCVSDPATACPKGFIAVETADATFACVAVNVNPCDGGLLIKADTGVYSCGSQVNSVTCATGKVAVKGSGGTFDCVAVNQITCPTGSVVTEETNGTFNCVTQASTTLGQLTCKAGSVPNSTNTACVVIPQINCQPGNVPYLLSTDVWQCVDTASQSKVTRTVQSVITDCATKLPLTGVSIFLQGFGPDLETTTQTVKTAVNGTFTATGVAPGGTIVWTATQPGYEVKTGTIGVPAVTNTDTYNDPVFPTTCLTATPVPNLVIAGQVIAGNSPAVGATLYLYDTSSAATTSVTGLAGSTQDVNGNLVQGPITTDANGDFTFKAVSDSSYSIIVVPFTPDGGTLSTFGQLTWNCEGTMLTKDLLSCSDDFGNLRLVLPQAANQGLISYTSLLEATAPTVDGILVQVGQAIPSCPSGTPSAPGVTTTCLPANFTDLATTSKPAAIPSAPWILPTTTSTLVLRSDLPFNTNPADLIVDLFAIDNTGGTGTVTANLAAPLAAADIAFSADGNTLTLTLPGLTADQNNATFFQLRFRQLSYQNGQFLVVPGTPYSIYFDVNAEPAYLANPTPTLYAGEVGLATVLVADETSSHWLTAAPPNGYILQTDSYTVAASGAADGLTIGFTDVPGAAKYHVYARVSDDTNTFTSNDVVWQPIPADGSTTFVPTSASLARTTRYVDLDFSGVTFPTPSDWSPYNLGFGRELQIAVTSETADKLESPIDPTKALTVSDTVFLGMTGSPGATDTSPTAEADTVANYAIKSALIDFGEDIAPWASATTPSAPTLTLLGTGGVASLLGTPSWLWTTTSGLAATDTHIETGTEKFTELSNKYDVCTVVSTQALAGASTTQIFVQDVSGFAGLTFPVTAWAFSTPAAAFPTSGSIRNGGASFSITGVVHEPGTPPGSDVILVPAGLPTTAAVTGMPTGIAAGSYICVASGNVTLSSATAATATTLATFTVNSAALLIDGSTLYTLITASSATPPGVYAISVNGVVSAAGQSVTTSIPDITNAAAIPLGAYAGASAFRLPPAPGAWQEAQKLTLFAASTQAAGATTLTVNLEAVPSQITANTITVGDQVIVDVDGDWTTTADRIIGKVASVTATAASGAGPASEVITLTVPAGTISLTLKSLLIKLGPTAFQLDMSTMKDTSGNAGPHAGGLYTTAFLCGAPISDTTLIATPQHTVCAAAGDYGVY